jgi:hypothetical protein
METSFRLPSWFVGILFPLIHFVGGLKWPRKIRSVNDLHYSKALQAAIPGDLFLSYQAGNASNLFIPGYFKHVAVYIGGGLVVEAVGTGVEVTTLQAFMTNKDSVAHQRGKFATPEQGKQIAECALDIAKRPLAKRRYDYAFEDSDRAFYCAEIYVYCAKKTVGKSFEFANRMVWGVMTSVPDDFYRAKKMFDSVDIYGERPNGGKFILEYFSKPIPS